MTIGNGVSITNADIYCSNGQITIEDECIISGKPAEKVNIILNQGSLGCHYRSKLALERIWIRFGGRVEIGEYTNINGGSEIRSDESISIGSYGQISYDVKIWDTNTHSILQPDRRKEIARKYWPYYGYEEYRPITKPVTIGDFCWLGERSVIFKGSKVGSNVVIGFDTMIAGETIPDGAKVVTKREIRML